MKGLVLLSALVLLAAPPVLADWIIDEGFEGGSIPASWTVVDSDNDGRTWRALEHDYAHSGAWLAVTDCYESGGEDWLITPQVSVAAGDSFVFNARAWYGTEDFEVRLSTQTTSINDFDYVLDTVTGATATYVRYSYDLSAYAGESCYLAIRWQQDVFGMAVDDVKVGWGVYETTDVGMLSIEEPEPYQVIDTESYPSGTIQNYGTAEITESFDIICEIADETRAIVYSDTVTHAGTMAPEDTEVVAFTAAWAPTAVGNYTVTMTTFLAGDTVPENDSMESETEVVLHYGTGGPDAFSYRWIDSGEDGGPVYDWIEISETGTPIITYEAPYFYGDDNMSPPLPIGFSFPFYGIDRTEMYVDTNGEILLTDNTWFNHYPNIGWGSDGNMFNYVYPIPGYVEMPALVAAYWDDLMADEGVGDVYFQTFGTEPDRYCVIEWHDFRFRYGTWDTSTLTFEMILHEDGEIVFQYQDTGIGQT
ncbi:choice-of-anchor J domain-containing protein, partial [bacterium]|nr:choice-of-anchor J domain-containing protein [bacterium]